MSPQLAQLPAITEEGLARIAASGCGPSNYRGMWPSSSTETGVGPSGGACRESSVTGEGSRACAPLSRKAAGSASNS